MRGVCANSRLAGSHSSIHFGCLALAPYIPAATNARQALYAGIMALLAANICVFTQTILQPSDTQTSPAAYLPAAQTCCPYACFHSWHAPSSKMYFSIACIPLTTLPATRLRPPTDPAVHSAVQSATHTYLSAPCIPLVILPAARPWPAWTAVPEVVLTESYVTSTGIFVAQSLATPEHTATTQLSGGATSHGSKSARQCCWQHG